MLRKLLACLALLTGLAAAGVPAQAEIAVALASRVEASARSDTIARIAKVQGAETSPMAPHPAMANAPVPAKASPPAAPTVRLGSDRARE